MIKLNYIKKSFRDHLTFLIFAFLLTAGFQLLILSIFSTSEILKFIEGFVRQFPPQIQQLMGDEFIAQFSINGVAAFGYNHPIVLIFFAIIAIMMPAKNIGSEIEEGTLELLFSLPVKRLTIAFSLWIFSAMALVLLLFGCWLGTLWGLHIYPDSVNFSFYRIIQIGINLWFLMLTINGYTFLIASYSREGNKVALRAAGITLLFYFLNYAIKIWSAINFLKYFTIFNYYQPQKLMAGQANFGRNVIVLSLISLICLFLSFRRICKRDIPG